MRGFIGYFYILTFIIGFGAILLVSPNPLFKDAAGALIGGTNMAAVHLADAVGGNFSLVLFRSRFCHYFSRCCRINLAVCASAVSHDLYANVL